MSLITFTLSKWQSTAAVSTWLSQIHSHRLRHKMRRWVCLCHRHYCTHVLETSCTRDLQHPQAIISSVLNRHHKEVQASTISLQEHMICQMSSTMLWNYSHYPPPKPYRNHQVRLVYTTIHLLSQKSSHVLKALRDIRIRRTHPVVQPDSVTTLPQ